MDRIKLEVRPRDGRGGKDARRLRAGGDVPGVVYGAKTGPGASIPVVVNIRDLRHAVSGPGGIHAIFDLSVGDEKSARPVVIKDLQLDPVRDRVIHVDFNEVRLDQPIQTVVVVHLHGTPHGVTMGGVLSAPTHELNISVLPTNIPESIEIDVSELDINHSMRLSDLTPPEGVTFLDDLEGTILATVTVPTVEEEPEPEEGVEVEEGVEGEAAEEGAEGEAGEGAAEEPEGSE